MRLEERVQVARPPEEVYAFMANVNNLKQCSDAIHEVRDAPDRAVQAGDTYTTVAKIVGRTVEMSHHVVKAESPSHLEIEGTTGSTKILVQMSFEPKDNGTEVVQVGEGEPGGALRFVGGMVERAMRHQMRSDLDNMKKILEKQS